MPIRKNVKAAKAAAVTPEEQVELRKENAEIAEHADAELKRRGRKKRSSGDLFVLIDKNGAATVLDGADALQEALGEFTISGLSTVRLLKCKEVKIAMTFKKG